MFNSDMTLGKKTHSNIFDLHGSIKILRQQKRSNKINLIFFISDRIYSDVSFLSFSLDSRQASYYLHLGTIYYVSSLPVSVLQTV